MERRGRIEREQHFPKARKERYLEIRLAMAQLDSDSSPSNTSKNPIIEWRKVVESPNYLLCFSSVSDLFPLLVMKMNGFTAVS